MPVSKIADANYMLQATAKEGDALQSFTCWDSEFRFMVSVQSHDFSWLPDT